MVTTSLILGSQASAQTRADDGVACAPPDQNEYLLLVVRNDDQQSARLREVVPAENSVTSCQYLDNDVVRVGGFKSVGIANSWAQYLIDVEGMQSFVTRPKEAGPQLPTEPSPESSQESLVLDPTTGNATQTAISKPVLEESLAAFEPKPLGEGYAVLVSYFNRPEVAVDMGQLLGQDIGVVAYKQSPFLLAKHTIDPQIAGAVLKQLSDLNFAAIIVDSRQAVLLAPAIAQTR